MKKSKVLGPKKVSVQLEAETTEPFYPYEKETQVLEQVLQHYDWWTEDNNQRKTRERGWDDINNAYYGILPSDWPFLSRTTDPRIRTTLLEKNARLTNKPMRGKVAPREGGDVVKAKIHNALIDFQWDSASFGGSMTGKIAITDLDTRMYGSKFCYNYWRTLEDKEGNLVFDGNELRPLSIMDCGMDPNCDHIRSAKWFQWRDYMPVENLVLNKEMYPGLKELQLRLNDPIYDVPQKRRDSNYESKIKQIRGIPDRMGTDKAFPVVEVVKEFRLDKWVIFCPKYHVILAILDNPYEHGKIPINQLRYYPSDNDNIGESEVESVIPLWKAIQAVMCAFLDEVILKMRPPLKGVEGSFRMETVVYAPTAIWLMDNINALTEVETRADSVRYFQNTYPSLVSAFNVAMGDLSQGTSNLDPMQADKTATEIRQVARQQNIRDQKNQQDLAEFIKDVVMMWIANNKQFLFRDPKKNEYVLKILGQENFDYFKQLGMDDMVVSQEGADYVSQIMTSMQQMGVEMSDDELNTMIDASKMPKYPVATNPKAKSVENMGIRPKMTISERGDAADLSIVPDDMDGLYDFIPDVKSMDSGASEARMFARTQALQMVTNPNVLQLLQLEGKRPKIADLLIADFEDKGLNDAQRFFEAAPTQPPAGPTAPTAPGNFSPTGGTLPNQQAAGMANPPAAPTQSSIEQQMAGLNGLPQ